MHIDLLRQTDTQLLFDGNPLEVESMRIWHCKDKHLSKLSAFKNLRLLEFGSFPDQSLEVIGSLPLLRYLKVVHLPKVSSLAPIAQLKDLRNLILATLPSRDSDRKRTIVESLSSLAGLKALRLELFGICPPDYSLRALYGCTWLLTARFSQFHITTVEEFYESTGAVNDFNPPAHLERFGLES